MTVVEEYYRDNYEELVKRYVNRAGSYQNAEDIVQEAFARCLQYLPNFDGKMPFENYFSRILQNSFREFKVAERNYGMNMSHEEADTPCPIDLENKRLVYDVKQYIRNNMPKDEREILELYYIKGYSLKDVQKITDEKYRRVNYVVYKFADVIKERF